MNYAAQTEVEETRLLFLNFTIAGTQTQPAKQSSSWKSSCLSLFLFIFLFKCNNPIMSCQQEGLSQTLLLWNFVIAYLLKLFYFTSYQIIYSSISSQLSQYYTCDSPNIAMIANPDFSSFLVWRASQHYKMTDERLVSGLFADSEGAGQEVKTVAEGSLWLSVDLSSAPVSSFPYPATTAFTGLHHATSRTLRTIPIRIS